MSSPIAIVGMACRYPDADSVDQLFENSLAQRRAFRRMPDVRLDGAGYFDDSGKSADRAYVRQAAVLKGFEFDRERFRVSKSSFDVTDLTHWLALTVAGETLDDIRFRQPGSEPDKRGVRVVIGNTLTGEFSRSNLMRLRWPYVRGVVAQHLRDESPCLDDAEHARLLRDLEARYKRPFPIPNEDFLAGGLANTIAGRVCNHFDFNGGGYTVDGACSSSLLAVTDACAALACGDADMALAGGVDLSLDPFELVGFSRTSALARDEMLVYDEQSQGFWPGEGCGFVALMRYEDALERCERIHAVIHGWGISSDGKGGLTRPESEGQKLALGRTYRRAGYGIESVGYFEGHGTGTKVGDAAELTAVITARAESGKQIEPAVISSIKANIGHTKAAAGLAGLLRATKCVGEKILPPTTACRQPHTIFAENENNLSASDQLRDWESASDERRAGVSAMGFGGINSHLTIEEAPGPVRTTVGGFGRDARARLSAFQDAELFLFGGSDRGEISATVAHVSGFAGVCSRAELTDLAVELALRADRGEPAPWRAAVVAATPEELAAKLEQLANALDDGVEMAAADGVFLSGGGTCGKIGLIFPGQGAPAPADGGIHGRRFAEVRETYPMAGLGSYSDREGTDYRQLAITAASLCGLRMLQRIGTEGDIGIGHSLGELSALHWAGCYGGEDLLEIASVRGRAMVEDNHTSGAMVAVAADREATVAAIGEQPDVFVANINSPKQTVVSGGRDEIEALTAKLRREGVAATPLDVRQAFHTPAMGGVAERMGGMLDGIDFRQPERRIISTVSGSALAAGTDIVAHLCDQLVSPVQFADSVSLAAKEVDVFLEVGPGQLMSNLVRGICDTPVIPIDVGSGSLAPFLQAAAAAYVLGRAPSIDRLFLDRFARPFDWEWDPKFIQNPCEANPEVEADPGFAPEPETPASPAVAVDAGGDARERLRHVIAERTGLPAGALQDSSRMLSDLHLNSITVGEIVTQTAAAAGLQAPVDPTEYADASILQIAEALDQLASAGAGQQVAHAVPDGVGSWVRCFETSRAPAALEESGGAPERARGTWEGFGADLGGDTELLRGLNQGAHGSGVIVWIGTEPGTPDLAPLLQAAQSCIGRASQGDDEVRFVVVQPRWGASGFARSFFLENREISTLVINVPDRSPGELAETVTREIAAAPAGFSEVFTGADGEREEARLCLVESVPTGAGVPVVGQGDVVVVTGGGKGISAECGFQLARRTGCALLILGRSDPAENEELANNLGRLHQADLRISYQLADVTDATAVADAVRHGVAELGAPVTGIVHGAGLNHPRSVANLSLEDLEATLSPKIDGLRNLLGAVEPAQLKLLATFSSIIARIGLQGEADYALANEWLSRETENFKARHPDCRCRAFEWSVWSGTGMGQRLGRLDSLLAQGISPVSIDDGVREFLHLVDTPGLPTSLIVSGRFGNPPTVEFDRPISQARAFRFIDSIPVYYPRTELVAEWQLSAESDPYLDDHVLNGERLFPAVMALEAMTEGVVALMQAGREAPSPTFSDVVFRKAIVAPADGQASAVTLRLTALAEPDGEIALAIRSSATEFQVNHIEARCRLRGTGQRHGEEPEWDQLPAEKIQPFDPDRALYHNVLFQDGAVPAHRGLPADRGPVAAAASFRPTGRPSGFLAGSRRVHSCSATLVPATRRYTRSRRASRTRSSSRRRSRRSRRACSTRSSRTGCSPKRSMTAVKNSSTS